MPGVRGPIQKSGPCGPLKSSVIWLHCAMFVPENAADFEFDFVLMTSAYSQYLREL